MISQDVLPVNGPRVRVSRRECQWADGTALVSVPLEAREGVASTPEGEIRYVMWWQAVMGGSVQFFVHDANPSSLCGKKITADVRIIRNTLADRREYLHVDLVPTSREPIGPLVRIAAIATSANEVIAESGFTLFELPRPLRGVIVLAPVDSKILTRPRASTAPTTPRPSAWSSNDSQLERYLTEGWSVAREDAMVVVLTKPSKNGAVRTLQHKRPKKNAQG